MIKPKETNNGFVDELDEHLNHKKAFELDPDLWHDQDEKGGNNGLL